MRRTIAFLALGFGLSPAHAADPAADGVGITEATDYGRELPAPTADRPVYVVIHSGGQHDFGQVPAGESTPSADALIQKLTATLGQAHYLPADGGHPASLLIVVNWGTHCALPADTGDATYRNLYDRAALVGGAKFSDELRTVIDQTIASTGSVSNAQWGPTMPGGGAQTPAQLMDATSPTEMFRKRDPMNRRLMEQTAEDCYYVVVSAFDFSTVTTARKKLFWRTKLTTPTRHTSMAAAVPALIANGAGYYGRPMDRAEFFADRGR